jgi:hypothetical protein
MSKVSHNGQWILATYNYMYLQSRNFSNKHSEPTTICSCKTDNKCTAKAHGQNEYSEPTTICTWKTDNFLINIRNQQLYVLAKQTIKTLLKLMVKMNTRNWKKGRLISEKILKIWKKRKLKSEKIRKIFSFFRFVFVLFMCVSRLLWHFHVIFSVLITFFVSVYLINDYLVVLLRFLFTFFRVLGGDSMLSW